MAALPKKRISKSRGKKRQGSKVLRVSKLIKCENCGKLRIPHRVCLNCGFYKGRAVIKVKDEVKVTKVGKDEG